jgi:hypothetical protein
VRLVDGEQRHADVAQPLRGVAEVEALGRDVEQLELAPSGALETLVRL